MQTGAITSYIDVAQLTLYAFWIFFAGLIWYLHRENKREGYPLISDRSGRVTVQGLPPVPSPKHFHMADGTTISVPRIDTPMPMNAAYANKFPGAPIIPTGEPMLAAVGPGAYAQRRDEPEHTFDDNLPKIVPLRAAPAFFLAWEDPNLTGFSVIGSDGVEAGTIVETWIDRSEVVARYLEVQLTLPATTHRVLLPLNYADIRAKQHQVRTSFIRGEHFAMVPVLKHADTITSLEEDKITAFYAGGMLYATPGRVGPML